MSDNKKEIQKEIITLKAQFKEYKSETLKNFKNEKMKTFKEYKKEYGKVPNEIKEEYKQKEQKINDEIEAGRQEMLEEVQELKEELNSIKSSRSHSRNEVNLANKKVKELIGGQILRNHSFYRKMARSGIKNTPMAWHKINSQIRKEIKEGTVKSTDVERRLDELIKEISPNHVVVTEDQVSKSQLKNNVDEITKKGKISIQIPYQTSGVNDAMMGGAFIGSWGTALGRLNEGKIRWSTTDLLFLDEGINVKSTGQVILYKDITNVILGEKGRLFRTVTVLTESKENLVYKTGNNPAEASKQVIEKYMKIHRPKISPKTVTKEKETPKEKAIDEADALMKYASLYEKGLLTKGEFETKKAEILGITPQISHFEPEEDSDMETILKCPNCGEKIGTTDKFCFNCGFNLEN